MTIAFVMIAVAALIILIIAIQVLGGENQFALVSEASGDGAYLAIFLLVFGDAICALLPGETTLNTASALAAEGVLELGLVMLAGALGAVLGDSALYWLVRLNRHRFQKRMDDAMRNKQVAAAMDLIGSSAPLLLVVGRYVPGLRFVINVTMGLAAHPYRQFLLWSSIGGTLWSVYTCGLAYVVGTALAGFPLASVVIAGAITTSAIAVVFLVVRHRRTATAQH